MKREPIYYFKTLDETGISEVPADSLVIIENGDKGEDLELYVLDTDSNHIKTLTLRKYLQNNSHLYKMGGFATKENTKKIEVNKKNIAINVIDIKKIDGRVTINENEILNNEKDILKNENNIGYNRVQIDRNKIEVDRVDRDTIQNTKDILHDRDHMDSNEQRIVVLEKSAGITPNPENKIDSYYFNIDDSQLLVPGADPTKADIVAILNTNNIEIGTINGYLHPNVTMTLNVTENGTQVKDVYMISIESGNTSVFAMTKMIKMI